jgi:hypothetical protein
LILPLARILIRHSNSVPIRTHLENGIKKYARKLNFEELYITLYSLSAAYKNDAVQISKFKQIELDVLAQLKAAKTKNLRILAERVILLD